MLLDRLWASLWRGIRELNSCSAVNSRVLDHLANPPNYNERCFPYLRSKILFDKAVFCSAQAPNSPRRVEEFTALTINLQPLSDPNNIGDRQPGADFIPVFLEDPE